MLGGSFMKHKKDKRRESAVDDDEYECRECDIDIEKIKKKYADKTVEELEAEIAQFKEEFKKKHNGKTSL
jgi:hypothetical protein